MNNYKNTSKFTAEQIEYLERGIETEDPDIIKVRGSFKGDIGGEVKGYVYGNVWRGVEGDVRDSYLGSSDVHDGVTSNNYLNVIAKQLTTGLNDMPDLIYDFFRMDDYKYLKLLTVALSLFLIIGIGSSLHREMLFIEKCNEAGMIAVSSWLNGALYCVEGVR